MKSATPAKDSRDAPSGHSVQVVSRETGLSPDTLRAWERRYAAVVPDRSEGHQRLYTDEQVERLKLLAGLVRGGRRIKDVAGLGIEAMEKLARRDAALPPPPPATPSARIEACMQAIAALDGPALDAALAREASASGAAAFVEGIIPAVLREIGERWEHGTLGIAHEHLATVRLRARLVSLLAEQQPPGGAPLLLVTTPAGERHELGALSAAIIGATVGWRAVFLGASVPAADIASAARQLRADVIALSILHPEKHADVDGELRRLTEALGRGVTVLVGGPAALSRRQVIEDARGRVLEDFAGLRRELAVLATRARS